ncbi:hypothetical protein UFOVP746_3 [uncultured Caudovirales phage]|jgi:hypothetical protein|uniref:Uncharacterized protein n=1 Tax=uncultured Caudovirales phage TaxID=2100421 RepID=A0A6J7X718_9CAUD|nr:hypothetical protein UFOVP746_3 [uncultured Caudovirales phage]
MSITTILRNCETVAINDHRFVGQVISRNQRISTSEILTVVPFAFDMKPMNYLLYSQNRVLLNSLRIPDMALEQYLNFGATGWVNYIDYQGDMTANEILLCEWQETSAAKVLVLGSLPETMAPTDFIVKIGDFCQVGRYAYIATANVMRGSGETVNIPVHRNLITTLTSPVSAVIGQYGNTISMGGNIYVGVTFPVILREYPTYTLMPMANDSFIQWNGMFKAFESVL